MDVIFRAVRWQLALVYLDSIVNVFKFLQEHIGHVRTIVTLLRNAGATPNFKKYRFVIKTIDYLGHAARTRCLETTSNSTNAIQGLRKLKTTTKLSSFLRLCNMSQKFVPYFARLAAPLNAKLRKDQPITFASLNKNELKSIN